MGIILSALAAAGDAGVQSMNQNIEQQNRLDLETQRSDLELAKAKALSDYQIQQQEGLRQQRTGAIQEAVPGIIQQQQADRVNANYGDGSNIPLSDMAPEELASQPVTERDKAMAALQAEAKYTGDYTKMATLLSTADIAQSKQENFQARTEMMSQVADIRAQAVRDAAQARVDAANERASNGKVSASTLTMLINSENNNIKASTSMIGILSRQLPDLTGQSNKEQRAAVQAQITGAQNDIAQSRATKNVYLKSLGMPTSDDLPEPEAKTLSSPTLKYNPTTGKIE